MTRNTKLALSAWLGMALPAATATADPAAWRITGDNGAEVTLLGSMHVLRPTDHPLPAAVDGLIERADSIAMELDLDDLDAMAQQRAILATAMLPQGTALADVVEPPTYRLLEQTASELGIELELLARFEPWFLAITLLDLGMRKFGFQSEHGIEQYVLGQAQRDRKEIVGLETLEFQIGIFDALPASSQEALLEQTLAELDEAETAMREMVDAWRDGKLEDLSAELLDDFEQFPGLYETLVTKRNRSWVPPLEQMLADGRRHLVVVGALHLVGRDNVIELLRQRGHSVERVH